VDNLSSNGTTLLHSCAHLRNTKAMTKTFSLEPSIHSGSRLMHTALTAYAGLALLTACFVGGAQADELLPIQSRTIAMGLVNGDAYYTNDAAGLRLVATLNGDEGGTPVRLATTLATGQSVTLSVPAGVGEPAVEVRFSRRGDRVFVDGGNGLLETARSR
jgi:hypothetical protein